MTALAAPVTQSEAPSAWARMIWVAWRQHRTALAGVFALLGGLSLLLLVNGLYMRASMRDLGLTACHPMTGARCAQRLSLFQQEYGAWSVNVPRFAEFAPVLIGAFMGGPLLARELESGTFRFAWTQGTGRTRWVIAKLFFLAAAVTAAAGAFTSLFSWWHRPLFAAGGSLMEPRIFDMSGVDFAAWTLFAFALGAFAGVAIRRVVPALAAAIAGWTGVALAAAFYLRPRYRAALTAHAAAALPARSYVMSMWWSAPGGERLSTDALVERMQRLPVPVGDFKRWPVQHGYTQWLAYQPESRFWHFQAIEGAGLLVASLLLGAAAVWWARHHTA
jgi:hypothetical protein